jgi:hypothetical protein
MQPSLLPSDEEFTLEVGLLNVSLKVIPEQQVLFLDFGEVSNAYGVSVKLWVNGNPLQPIHDLYVWTTLVPSSVTPEGISIVPPMSVFGEMALDFASVRPVKVVVRRRAIKFEEPRSERMLTDINEMVKLGKTVKLGLKHPWSTLYFHTADYKRDVDRITLDFGNSDITIPIDCDEHALVNASSYGSELNLYLLSPLAGIVIEYLARNYVNLDPSRTLYVIDLDPKFGAEKLQTRAMIDSSQMKEWSATIRVDGKSPIIFGHLSNNFLICDDGTCATRFTV